MKRQTPIKRWMKMPAISARGIFAHFILAITEDGVYITTCGKANGRDYSDLTQTDEAFIEENPSLLCYFCSSSPRYYHARKELERSGRES